MGYVFLLAFIGFIAWLGWSATKPRSAFVVRIEAGVPRATRGRVTSAFLEEIQIICHSGGIKTGSVEGVYRDDRIVLTFSSDFSEPVRQQLRNVWTSTGWSGPLRSC